MDAIGSSHNSPRGESTIEPVVMKEGWMVAGNRSATYRTRHVWIGLILICVLFGNIPRSHPTSAASPTATAWLPLVATEPALPGDVPEFKHIFTIVLENKG